MKYDFSEKTIGMVEAMIKKAYEEGWESDDSFLLAIDPDEEL